MRHKCVICGKAVAKRDLIRGIPVHRFKCSDMLVAEIQGYFSIAGFTKEDLCDNELITREEADAITLKQELRLAKEVGERFWADDTMGNSYQECLPGCVVELERMRIEATAPKDLPKLLGTIKNKENETFLAERLKKGK